MKSVFCSKGILLTLIALLLVSALALTACGNQNEKDLEKELIGVWVYDVHTTYEFATKDSGCMHIDEHDFEFSYKLDGDQLSIDFKNDAMYDCVYTVAIEGDTLKLVGGEGTVGGTYSLNRK